MNIDKHEYISEQDFVLVWGAHYNSDEEFYSYNSIVGLEVRTVWTAYEDGNIDDNGCSDNTLYAMPGIVPALAIGYLVTTKAWSKDTPHAIWYLDDDVDAAEDRRLEYLRCVL